MKKGILILAAILALVLPLAAQNPASNKAFFVAGTNELTVADVAGNKTMTILNAPNAIKTSTNGALEVSVSLESALWTYNTVTAISGKGQSTSSSRAAIVVWVEVDGVMATPEKVVFNDRLQVTGLQVETDCQIFGIPLVTCEVTDTITLDLFQKTKEANSFNFFIGPLSPTIHSIVVKASGVVECTADGQAITCPATTLDKYTDAKTAAAVGKRTVVIEEHNNWGAIK